MKRILLLLGMCLMSVGLIFGQTTILDFEAPATSTVFEYFGNAAITGTTQVIENPDKSGINTSDSVGRFYRAPMASNFAGAFSNPNPTTPVDLSGAAAGDFIYLKVWMPNAGPGKVRLKLEQGTGGDWEQEVSVTVREQWTEVIFNPNADFAGTTAAGNSYNRVVLFFDFDVVMATDTSTYFFDDLAIKPAPVGVDVTILDFETPTTTTDFEYFGNGSVTGLSSVIENPDKSGLNTSDSVTAFNRGVMALDFAGGFTNPNPTQAADFQGVNTVQNFFMKVWVPTASPGNVRVKFEQGTGPDWEQELNVPASEREQWVDLEFRITEAFNNVSPAGKKYDRIVLFFDFGVTMATDTTTYFLDDIRLAAASPPPAIDSVDITFNLNMKQETFDPANVYIAGGGNFGVPGDFQMTDPDGDSIFTIVVRRPEGFNSFYKFANGNCPNFSCVENLAGLPCADPNNFDDRFLPAVFNDTVVNACFGNCVDNGTCTATAPDSVDITFNLNMKQQMFDPANVYIAGGAAFGQPGDFPMLDPDGDSIFTITVRHPAGFTSDYTFTNGFCPGNFSCKENIAGQACAVPPFNDRRLPPVFTDTTVSTCFGFCTTDGSCPPPVTDSVNITFNVNTESIMVDSAGIYIAGGGNFGSPGDFALSDPDGDGIWSITIRRPEGFMSFYTFTNGACTDFSCKENIAGQACANPNNFNDRFLPGVFSDTTLNTCFGACTDDGSCPNLVNVTFSVDAQALADAGTLDSAGIFMGGSLENPAFQGQIAMTNVGGSNIFEVTLELSGDASYEYKFLNGAGFGADNQETFDPATSDSTCTLTSGAFTNRFAEIGSNDTTIGTFVFDSCGISTRTTSISRDLNSKELFSLVPNTTSDMTRVIFAEQVLGPKQIEVLNANGQRVIYQTADAGQTQVELDVQGLAEGMYFVRVTTGEQFGYQKMLIVR
ncbi:MAG: T9SS type A sorting domain-containing protein [Bacteroidota bacterium]